MVERGHRPITEALAYMTNGGLSSWVKNLPIVLLADRTTVHQPTGKTPFFMVYGREAVLPVELKYPTWRVLNWEDMTDRASLLATRAQQLQLRDEDIEEVVLRKRRKRSEGKDAFDSSNRLRQSGIVAKDIVLRHDAQSEIDKSSDRKLVYKWYRPYRIKTIVPEKGTYILEELDRTLLPRTFAGNRLKKFVKRKGIYEPETSASDLGERSEEEEEEEKEDESEEEELRTGDLFEIVVPQLSEDKRREYLRHESEEN
jgi:hypothetical protein